MKYIWAYPDVQSKSNGDDKRKRKAEAETEAQGEGEDRAEDEADSMTGKTGCSRTLRFLIPSKTKSSCLLTLSTSALGRLQLFSGASKQNKTEQNSNEKTIQQDAERK